MLGSVLLNIPKFFESELVTYELVADGLNTTCNITLYDATPLRVDPDYVFYYVHWTRLVWLGTMTMIRNIFKIYLFYSVRVRFRNQTRAVIRCVRAGINSGIKRGISFLQSSEPVLLTEIIHTEHLLDDFGTGKHCCKNR